MVFGGSVVEFWGLPPIPANEIGFISRSPGSPSLPGTGNRPDDVVDEPEAVFFDVDEDDVLIAGAEGDVGFRFSSGFHGEDVGVGGAEAEDGGVDGSQAFAEGGLPRGAHGILSLEGNGSSEMT